MPKAVTGREIALVMLEGELVACIRDHDKKRVDAYLLKDGKEWVPTDPAEAFTNGRMTGGTMEGLPPLPAMET